MFAACVHLAIVQTDKVTNIERDKTTIFLRGEIQLGFVGQTEPLCFESVNGVITTFAKSGGQRRGDIFVEEDPQFHFIQAAASSRTCPRQCSTSALRFKSRSISF
jgi:hypothetical protein